MSMNEIINERLINCSWRLYSKKKRAVGVFAVAA